MSRFASIVLSVSILAGCGGGSDSNPTRRELAGDVATALCDRGRECEGGTDAEYQACLDDFVSTVCATTECEAVADQENLDAIDACIAAAPTIDCAAEDLPPECVGVL